MSFDFTNDNAMSSDLETNPHTWASIETMRTSQKQKNIDAINIHQKAIELNDGRIDLVRKFKLIVEEIRIIQIFLQDTELIEWKSEQQLAGNGKLLDGEHLNNITEWCDKLAEIIWLTRQQMIVLESLHSEVPLEDMGINNMLTDLKTDLTNLLTSLVNSSLVIEKQPLQVIETNNLFSCTVRLLVGHALNVYMKLPTVTVSIITDAAVSSLLQNECRITDACYDKVLNDTQTMMYNKKNKQMSVEFTYMKLGDVKALRKRKNMETKESEDLSEQKFALYFQTSFDIGGGELIYTVWTISLPVVVTGKNTSQDAGACATVLWDNAFSERGRTRFSVPVVATEYTSEYAYAWATVLWDNAFSERGRTSFSVPESVPWCKVADMLNMWVTALTGKGLTDQNIKFLAEKVFRNSDILLSNDSLLTRFQFCKDYLPDKGFTFWRWFYEIIKVIADYMKPQWKHDLIEGFIGGDRAEELLKNSLPGTFILMFSDSELGGLTIAWVSEKNVHFNKPFCKNELSIRGLHDRIHDLQHLIYLFPSQPKESAFEKCSDTSVMKVNQLQKDMLQLNLRL